MPEDDDVPPTLLPCLSGLQRLGCIAVIQGYVVAEQLVPTGAQPRKVATMLVSEFGAAAERCAGAGVDVIARELYCLVNDVDSIPTGNQEEAEVDIPWKHMLAIAELIHTHMPTPALIQQLARSGREEIRRVEEQEELEKIKGLMVPSVEGRGSGPTRTLTSKEKFALEQAVRSGAMDASVLVGIQDEGQVAPIDIEISDVVPKFLTGRVARSNTNFRKPALNLAEVRDREEKNTSGLATLDAIGGRQERLNADRKRQTVRRRREMEEERRVQEAREAELGVVDEGRAAEEGVRPITQGELDEAQDEGGVRSVADAQSKLPPWMKKSIGKVEFGVRPSTLPMAEQRRGLPVYAHRDEIIAHVKSHAVTVLQGETGSGKTTQIPQYLYEGGLAEHGMIAITQPRRVAAVELAKRVADEFGCRCGEEVGYTVRFADQTSPVTKIKFMTDGMLLREALLNDTFDRYSVVILDEAHERSINTDVLFGVLKTALRRRPDLKVVVTSATIELDKFCRYFNAGEPLKIKGRTHPVTTSYSPEPVEDYVSVALRKVLEIHLREPEGDILVFFTGQDEIETAAERLHSMYEDLKMAIRNKQPPPAHFPDELLILPCYATLQGEGLTKVFDPTPAGMRKVVLSTNVAETSVTIDGLRYVVDCGFCKQHIYDPKNNVDQLKIVPVSQAQAVQREGRAGRTGPGRCFRLFTEEQFHAEMSPSTIPEIQRTNLANIVLTLKAVGIDDLFNFEFLDPPPTETLVQAMQKLRFLEALDDDGLLTPLGQRMSAFPLQPSESKTLLSAVDMGCAPSILTIVSMLSMRSIFYSPPDKKDAADAARRMFQHPDGDQLTLLAVYESWEHAGRSLKWCQDNFVNPRSMEEASRSRSQLYDMLALKKEYAEKIKKDHRDSVLIRKALTAGYFFNVGKRADGVQNSYVTMSDRREVYIHPTSSMFLSAPKYLLYNELVMTAKEYMRTVMEVKPEWLVEVAPAYFRRPKEGELTKEQRHMRVEPILLPWEKGNSWRISKLKLQK